jgi:Glucose-6-phosphate dehydrogenase, NAD binding domain
LVAVGAVPYERFGSRGAAHFAGEVLSALRLRIRRRRKGRRQEGRRPMIASRSDARVLFGVTGDLAHKMIFPALYAMAKRGALKVPVIGGAFPKWSLARLHKRVTDSIKRSGGSDNQRAFHHLLSQLKYVSGDYEVLVELKPPPQRLFADSAPVTGRANYLRFRLSPSSAVALAARVKLAGKEFVGDQRELYLFEEQPGEEAPYERLSFISEGRWASGAIKDGSRRDANEPTQAARRALPKG